MKSFLVPLVLIVMAALALNVLEQRAEQRGYLRAQAELQTDTLQQLTKSIFSVKLGTRFVRPKAGIVGATVRAGGLLGAD